MATSASGVITFFVLVLAGPLFFLASAHIKQRRGSAAEVEPAKPAPHEGGHAREEVSGINYLMGLLGYAIGIGNLWRFPYLVGKWGGGAFVLAYLVSLVFVAIPIYVAEMVIGQYTRKSTIECFSMIHPRWTGLGAGQGVMLLIVLGYYNVLLAYACVYVIGSLSDPLPWAANSTSYWQNDVLNNYDKNYDGVGFGGVQWNLAIALLVVWLIVFFSVAFGKDVLAKVTWVTVVGPVVMLFVLLIRAVFLDGAADGIKFYIGKFDTEKLSDLDMWAAACGQILFSLSPGMGTAITLSSYTQPKEDVVKTCMIVSLCNSAFSLIGGIAIFSIVGNNVYNINQAGGEPTTVEDQSKAGAGLAFIQIANGMQTFGAGANVVSVTFFMVLLTLGFDSTFAWLETLLGCIEDALMKTNTHVAKWKLVGVACINFYLAGLPFCTRIGNELLDTVDHYIVGYFLLIGVALEAAIFLLGFGWRRLVISVKRSTLGNKATPTGRDIKPEIFWFFCLAGTVPMLSSFLFAFNLLKDLRKPYEGYPDWVQAIGWCCLLLVVSTTVIGGAVHWNGKSSLTPIEEEEALLKVEAEAAAEADESAIQLSSRNVM
mmetsp:Transcript_74076/g.205814  ORF Transcript_74076/g.205814 Transcript_74076/m.205814 type:complete len:599 (-) Transcript_74076:37-1833(-)|eukprot:CAMPEP_0117537694 /NCGR_PEP_ID=MMETSP0784-20121206/42101_1 /TAXON_ID=39447 /ORGANISM="" /LENGTH=598 /DNA_ID=CAMNT_0005334297 /DNA_START=69 /DNA_END=1865 /DNA_ORIENTATION=-